jgi:hypothetical protein
LQESNENNFVELLEIKKKYNSDVTSSAIGNVICLLAIFQQSKPVKKVFFLSEIHDGK